MVLQKGGSVINYNYLPNANQQNASAVAYEYVFTNIMEKTVAINLKSMDTTGVNVSFVCGNERIDTNNEIEASTKFTLQQLPNKGDSVYIYILVSPTAQNIPSTFTQRVVWYYGVPKQMPIVNPIDNTATYQTIVDGQKIDKSMFVAPPAESVPTGYYFDALYLDKEYTKPLTDDLVYSDKVYARYANLPTDWLTSSGTQSWVVAGTSTLPENLIIPNTYNGNKVFAINARAFFNNTTIKSVDLPYSITIINTDAFNGCANLQSIVIPEGLEELRSSVFNGCTSLISVTLPDSLTTLSNNGWQFHGCTTLKYVKLSSNMTSIPTRMFDQCANLRTVDNFSNNTKLNTIESCAFYYCEKLTGSITIPASVTKIGERAFRGTAYSEIKFVNTSNWYVTTNTDYTGGTLLSSSDLSTNSTQYLKETYYSYYWHK